MTIDEAKGNFPGKEKLGKVILCVAIKWGLVRIMIENEKFLSTSLLFLLK